jgi:uncharacterized protein YxjI
MRYTMDGKWRREQFAISDGAGVPQFRVTRIYGLDGNSLSLRDLQDRELAAIRPRSGPARFEVERDGHEPVAVRHRGLLGKKYAIAAPAGEVTVIVAEEYLLTSAGTVRATVLRGMVREQNLTIEIADGEDAAGLLAVILAIETIRADRQDAQAGIPVVGALLRLME